MKNIVCRIFGHKWKFPFYKIGSKESITISDYKCMRCGVSKTLEDLK